MVVLLILYFCLLLVSEFTAIDLTVAGHPVEVGIAVQAIGVV